MDEAVPFRSEPSVFETSVKIKCDNLFFANKNSMYQISPKKQGYLLVFTFALRAISFKRMPPKYISCLSLCFTR